MASKRRYSPSENHEVDERQQQQQRDKEEKPPNKSVEEFPKWMFWKRRRYIVAVLALFGFFNVYSLRVNLSIAIVAMTTNRSIESDNGTMIYQRDFDWDSKMQGFVLSSFFYGYIATQLFGGWLAARIGGKKVLGVGILMTALLTLITPLAAHTNVYFLVAIRIMEGVFEGVTYPCIHAIWSKWSPPLERSGMAALAFSGSHVGTVVSMPVCAYLADAIDWESIFYVFGTIAIIWCIVWWLVVAESPAEDPRISKEELRYIEESLGHTANSNKRIKHPWRSFLTSAPVWAIVVSHFCENWGFYTLLTQLPTFLNDILAFDLGKTGIMSAIPYLVLAIMMQFAGQWADWLRAKDILSTTNVRKMFNCGAFVAQTAFMLGTAFWLSKVGAMFCLTMAVAMGAFAWAGFSVNHLDIAPQHASVLMGLGNTFATLPGILSPIISGYIVTTPTADEWRIVFYMTCVIYLFGCLIYGCFASGELQPWAEESETLQQSIDERKTKEKEGGIANTSFQCES